MLLILGASLLALYVILLAVYLFVWWTWPHKRRADRGSCPRISVVVPVRNERKNISGLLESLSNLDYPDYEIIVVDDHSDDGTYDALIESPHDIVVVQLREGPGGKKAALANGIRAARGEYIATTDADCRVGPAWLTSMMDCLVEGGYAAVTGPVCIRSWQGLPGAFQALDLAGLMVVTAAGLRLNWHTLSNGANLIFQRSVYEGLGGYSGHEEIASGDDLFFVQAVKRDSGRAVGFCRNVSSLVHTRACDTWSSLLSQRVRWGSKNRFLPEQQVMWIWGLVWAVNVLTLLLPVAVAMGMLHHTHALYFVSIKFAAESALLLSGIMFINQKRVMLFMPVAFIINILYVALVGLMALLAPQYTWKGRNISTA